MKKAFFYLVVIGIFVGSVMAAAFFPVSDWAELIIALPGVGALFLALFQLTRDMIAHERQVEIESGRHLFQLGVKSYMSEVTYDKHVEFCECYLEAVEDAVGNLFREGPTPEALKSAFGLGSIRRKFTAWLPEEVGSKLVQFENAFVKIGTKSDLVRDLNDGDRRSKAIKDVYELTNGVIGIGKSEDLDIDVKQDIAASETIKRVKEILGIESLFLIRSYVIEKSAKYVESRKE